MNAREKVLFIIPSLFGGGAQRVTTILLNHLNRVKFDLSLALVRKEGEFIDHIPADINVIDLNCFRVRYSARRMLQLIWKSRPDVVFSLHMDLNTLIALLRPLMPRDVRFVARATNLPSYFNQRKKHRIVLWLIYKLFYNNFDTVICQSKDMKQDFLDYAGIDETKLKMIHNPMNLQFIEKKLSEAKKCLPSKKINLLAAGKYTYQKGFDLLLQAIAKISDPSFHLTILGKGPDEAKLRHQANLLSINNRVTFAGFQSNPYEYMRQADLFILSSRYEGFPNVAIEANACGTPVVAFECPGGVNEIIEEGINGWKVKPQDSGALAIAIKKAAKVRLEPGRIKEYICSKFSSSQFVAEYEKVLLGSGERLKTNVNEKS